MKILTRIYLAFTLLIACSTTWAQLTPDFAADPRAGCAPIRVLFADLSGGNPDRWKWDLGNGVISTSKDPSTTYFTAGVYSIKLTVYKGTDSATITKDAYITVYAIPVVAFSGRPLVGCVPHPVQFTDSSKTGSGSLVEWTWDFGDGNLGTTPNPAHTYMNAGNFRVTLTVKNSVGCFSSASIDNYVKVNPGVVANFDELIDPSCKVPVSVAFTDKSVGANITSWQWSFGDGNTSTSPSPTHIYTVAGTYNVQLIVTNSSGCKDTLRKNSLLNIGNFAASYNMGTGTFCVNQPVSIKNISAPGPVDSTIWTFSDGVTTRQTDVSRIFTTTGTYSFQMEVWKNGCRDIASGSFTVLDKPGGTFSFTAAASCKVPFVVTFQNTTPNSTVLFWDFGDGQTSALQNPTITYTGFGVYTIKMAIQHTNGCLDTIVQPAAIRVEAPVISGVAGLPYDGCAPFANTFIPTIVSSDAITSWQWDFGDGSSANIEKPFKTYNTPGDFTVTLTITTVSGCTNTFTSKVRISSKPKADFEASPLNVCPSDIVFFTDKSTGSITKWYWQFGDGGTSTTKSPNYQYQDTGWMPVTLVVYNNNCADTFKIPKYVYVRPPIAVFTDSFVCANQAERFFKNSSIGATTWKWYFGDGDSSVVLNPTHIYSAPGTYKVKLMVADSACKHEASASILVLNEKANIEMESDGGCGASVYRFVARGPNTDTANISSYEWTINNGAPMVSTINFIEQAFTDSATLNIQLIIIDKNGCADTTRKSFFIPSVNLIANFGPVVQTVCVGSLVSFSDSTLPSTKIPIKKWFWNFGFGSDSVFTAAPFRTRYDSAGVYDVRLIVEDSLGCRDTILRKAAVVVHESIANFVASDTLICINSSVTFSNTSVGANGNTGSLQYQWTFGNGQSSTATNPVVNYPVAGVYSVSLSLLDVYGCRDTLLRPLYITVGNAKADFVMSDSFSSCPPLQVSFTNNSLYNASNFWDFGNGNNSNLLNPSHTYTEPGIFNVKLKVVGNGGCSDSLTKRVVIQGPSGVFSYAPLIGCPPLLVSFVSNAVNTKFYTWDYSDGQSDVTINTTATHAYLIPGNYVPRLILEDGLGCKLPLQGPDTIRVLGAKALIKNLANYTYCDSATIAFTDSSIVTDVIVRYKWKFGDGAESNLANPTHNYANPGRYQITLEVWTANGCYTNDTLQSPVVIAVSPMLDYARDSTVCVPAMVQFTGQWINPDTTVVSYNWNFGNGQTSTLLTPSPVSFTTPGLFNVSLIGTNEYGCADTIIKPINVYDTPMVVAAPFAYLCLGSSATLTASGAITYQWDAHPSLSCTNCSTTNATPQANYIYRVTGTDINGCQSSDTVQIKVKLPGNLGVGMGDTICIGESVQLRANGYEILRWSPAASLNNANIANPIARPTTTTQYQVTGTDSLNCFTDTRFVDVVVYQIPQFNIVETLIKTNFGSSVPFKTTSSPDVNKWLWTPSAGLDCATCPEPLATVTKKQIYTATVSNPGGCVAKDEVAVEPYCTADNIFLPNTFSPNGDGQNDVFYPRGTGITSIKSMMIFNRWGELVFERRDFALNDANAGWNGTFKTRPLTADVYVYVVEVQCGNNEVYGMKGNVTLMR